MLFLEVLFMLSCILGLAVMLWIHRSYPEGTDPSDDDSEGGGLPPSGDTMPVGPAPHITVPKRTDDPQAA